MVKPSGHYALWLEEEVQDARKVLPGNVRQRMKRALENLSTNPRPAGSKILDTGDLDIPEGIELRRLRLENWRLVYAVNSADKWVWALGIRKRPPYDYQDLGKLAARLRW
ncbi:MAG: type II toxin-antitoxin system RelE/ParE family toxin [Candidatus Roizmanbacteria bacterium]|nr:type II toxin-antitoxin system RelE/ParE family toxin [Candidatus Roizmanbacteria bacterium]